MKRYLIIVILMLIVSVSFGQLGQGVTKTGTQTLTNKTLTLPKINENVQVTVTSTEINQTDSIDAEKGNIQAQLDTKPDTSEVLYAIDAVDPVTTGEILSADSVATLLMSYPRKVDCGSNAAVSHTGNTTRTTVKTFPVAAGRIGINGELFIEAVFDGTTGTAAKTYIIVVNGVDVMTYGSTGNPYYRAQISILNRNSLSSQVIHIKSFNTGADLSVATSTIDTSGALTVNIDVKVDDASLTATLESIKAYTVY